MPIFNHLPELIVVMLLALLVFGPKRLPEMGSAVGKTIKEFKKTMSEVTESKEAKQITTTSTPTTVNAIEQPASEPVAK